MTAQTSTTKIEIPFDGSMDQRTHPRQVQAPNVLQAVNVRFRKLGGVEKRPGSKLIGNTFVGGYQLQPNAKVMSIRDEVLVVDGFRCGTYSSSAGQDRLIDKGKVPECLSRYQDINTSQYQIFQQTIAYSQDGLIFHAWVGQGVDGATPTGNVNELIFWTVQDANTGAEIASATVPYGGANDRANPQFVVMGSIVGMLYTQSIFETGLTSVKVFFRQWDPAGLTFGAETLLINSGTVTGTISVASLSDHFLLMYLGTDTQLHIEKRSTTFILVNDVTIPDASIFGLNMGISATGNGVVWAAYASGDVNTNLKIRATAVSDDLNTIIATPFDVYAPGTGFLPRIAVATRDATTALIAVAFPKLGTDTFTTQRATFPVVSTARAIVGNASAANRMTYWCVLSSQPFVGISSPLRMYAWAYMGGASTDLTVLIPPLRPAQYTSMLIDLMADDTTTLEFVPRPITWQAPRVSAPLGGTNALFLVYLGQLSPVATVPNGAFVTDVIVRRSNGGRLGVAMLTADFQSTDRYETCELGRTLFMTPGFFWDRSKWAEISYSYWPQYFAVSADGSGSTGTQQYLFRVCYEDLDGNLFTHRSDVSEVVTITPKTDTMNLTFTVPAMCCTARMGAKSEDRAKGIRIAIYRSIVTIATGAQSPWTLFALMQNDPRSPFVIETMSTTGNGTVDPNFPEGVYTDGGVLANVMPPGFAALCTYRNRVWAAQGNTVYLSKSFVTGDTVNFTDAFNIPLEETGAITALWKMDDTLLISTATAIYYLEANGPNDTNTESDLSLPNRVATDLGVLDQRSVAVTPMGTIYKSSVGIQLMDRSRSVDSEPLGARVQSDVATFPVVNSTVVHPTGRYVSFACAQPGGGFVPGIRLVFDYALNRWSRDTVLAYPSISSGQNVLSEVVHGTSVYYTIAQPGTSVLYREDASTNLDAGMWVSMGIELGEIHPASLQGELLFQRWTFLHEQLTDYDLKLSWTRNYEPSSFQTTTITSDKFAAQPVDQFSQNLINHRGMSMRVLMQDMVPSAGGEVVGAGSGARWNGITIDVDGIDQRARKLAPAQKT